MRVYLPAPNRTVGTVDVIGLMGLAGFLVARFIPVTEWVPFWGCAFKLTTGIPCPGCGLTRTAQWLSRGEVGPALALNPLGAVAGVGFFVAAVATLVHLAFRVPLPEVDLTARDWRRLGWGLGALVAVNYGYMLASGLH